MKRETNQKPFRSKVLFAMELILSTICGITLTFPILGVLMVLNELLRIFITIIFKYFYSEEELELSTDPLGANYVVMNCPKRRTILYMGEVEGDTPLDVESVRDMYEKHVLSHPAYLKKFSKIYTLKFGYVCMKKCNNFNITDHIRYYPGTENRTVTEHELLHDILPSLSDDMPLDKPQWEEVIIPRYSKVLSDEPESEATCKKIRSIKIIRMHHSYMDGASMLLMIANCFSEGKTFPYVIDPCKPLKISRLTIFLYRLQCLGLMSSVLIKNLLNPPFMRASRFTVPWGSTSKINFTLTNKLPIKSFQDIKEKSGASMSAIVSTVLAGAIRNFEIRYPVTVNKYPSIFNNLQVDQTGEANDEGSSVPDTHQTWLVAGMFPYQPYIPINNHIAVESNIDTSDISGCERLTLLHEEFGRLSKNPGVTTFHWYGLLLGSAPYWISSLFFMLASCPILLSNIPIVTRNIKLGGRDCSGIVGWVPLLGRCGIGIVTVRYAEHFCYCIEADSDVMTREELDYFTNQLEQQVEQLHRETSQLQRRISYDASVHESETEKIISKLTVQRTTIIEEDSSLESETVNDSNLRRNNINNNNAVNNGGFARSTNVDSSLAVVNEDDQLSFMLKLKDSLDHIKGGIKKIKEQ